MLEVGRESLKSMESVRGEEVRQLLARESIPLTSFLSGTVYSLTLIKINRGIFLNFYFMYCFSTLLHLPPLRFLCVRGCWDRNHDNCDSLVVGRSNHSARSGFHPRLMKITFLYCGSGRVFVPDCIKYLDPGSDQAKKFRIHTTVIRGYSILS
jgi:hypothetical protein